MRYFLFFLLSYSLNGFGQDLPNGFNPVYTTTEMPKIHIQIDSDSLEQIYLQENWYSNHEYPAVFIFETEEIADTIANVGFRLRGNTSRDKIKKSFKVSFNTFEPGAKYQDLEKLNLNAEVNDPSMIRSRMAWDLYAENGIAASRSNHVELYVNGEYYGLYQNIEHIDENFVSNRFGNNGGNLYKCSYPADLNYISSNPNAYKLEPFGTRTYELKTNTVLDDYSDLADFISYLNLSSNEELACGFSDVFNVHDYLKIAAIDVLTGNWDGYIYNQNNFYLYRNPITGRFEYIPYDIDNTWGIDWLGQNWAERNIYNFSPSGNNRPLYDRLMDIPKFRGVFTYYITEILADYHSPEHQVHLENLQAFISASALADPYRPLDFGYSEDDFLQSLYTTEIDHVDQAVFEFMEMRKASAESQLESTAIAPFITFVEQDFSDLPGSVHLTFYVDGPPSAEATLYYSINGGMEQSIQIQAPQTVYTFEVTIGPGPVELAYNFSITGQNNLSATAYCESKILRFHQDSPIKINEVQTANMNVISDDFGDFDDWIELYNSGSGAVNLSDYYLSDNPFASQKWALPSLTMNNGSFAMIWADDETDQGALHANFKLAATGEPLYLFRKFAGGLECVDYLYISAIPANTSMGRAEDGGTPWVLFQSPTPGASNQSGPLSLYAAAESRFTIYPNPTQSIVNFSAPTDFILFDQAGRKLQEGSGKGLDISALPSGIYILRTDYGYFRVLR